MCLIYEEFPEDRPTTTDGPQGIPCVDPGKLGIGVFSPGLDAYGNSVRGIKVCEEISERLGLHIFADDAEDALLGPLDSGKGN
jgi:hypothetical protein